MALSSGSRLGPYEILEPIGAGGMGEVYRARDGRLERDVALKVLPDELGDDEHALSRFRREARSVAALSHPNILAIHDFGVEGDVAYAVTELLEGQTLRERLEEGALTPRKAVSLSIQIMNGLAAAHEKGIVHRDLKPENLFLTNDGRAKILDFGLSIQETPLEDESSLATVSRRTEPGAVLGTLGYMSPEQARGRRATARSDIFSFGAVFYEMLAGLKAFRRESAADTLSAILKEDPVELPAHVPAVLRRIVGRCLEKAEGERFQSARDVAFALEAISDSDLAKAMDEQRGGRAISAIAVLPFFNMSPDPEQEYFCEGMAEEIINALTGIEGLRVASRMSAFQFKGKSGDVRKIGDALKVGTVLQGSVRTAKNRLRVTAQLINVEDGYQIWSERYDREMEDVFDIQDAISESIVSALRSQLTHAGEPPTRAVEGRRRTDNLEAYQLYLKGQHNWYKRYKDSLQKAARFFEGAVEKDPSYAAAHAGLADTYSSLAVYGYDPELARPRVRAGVERALALDDGLAEAHGALGLFRFWLEWDWDGAEREMKRAIELNPAYVLPYCWLGFLYSCTGRPSEAVEIAERARERDPLSPYANCVVGVALCHAGRWDEAVVELERCREMDGDFLTALYHLGWAQMRASRIDEAMRIFQRTATLAERTSFHLANLAWAHAAAGNELEATKLLEELRERAKREYVAPIFFAYMLGELGRNDEAFESLDRAYAERSPLMVFLVFPTLDNLRADVRFEQVLKKMALPASLARKS